MQMDEIIKIIYPQITDQDFANGTIILQDDNNGKGVYLKEWNHPSFAKPTEEQLKG